MLTTKKREEGRKGGEGEGEYKWSISRVKRKDIAKTLWTQSMNSRPVWITTLHAQEMEQRRNSWLLGELTPVSSVWIIWTGLQALGKFAFVVLKTSLLLTRLVAQLVACLPWLHKALVQSLESHKLCCCHVPRIPRVGGGNRKIRSSQPFSATYQVWGQPVSKDPVSKQIKKLPFLIKKQNEK